MWIWRRNPDGTRGEFVGYAWSPVPRLDGTYDPRPTRPPAVRQRARLWIVRDWLDWRAWRRCRKSGEVDLGLLYPRRVEPLDEPVKLNVTISPVTQAALLRVAERDGVTTTEALRRLVGYGDLVYTAHANGNHILIERGDAVERITSIHA